MLSFELTPVLVKSLKELQADFHMKYALISNLSAEELEFIYRYARISMVGASTRIENAVLTDSEINWIDTLLTQDGKSTAFQTKKHQIEDKLSKDRERSIEEVVGCRAMLAIIYEEAKEMIPFTESHLRGLHSELLQYYPKAHYYKGQYKKNSNSVVEQNHITQKYRDVFKTADAGLVTQSAMSDLIHWYNQSMIHEVWSIAVTCEFIFRFLAIHPFQDGNGRLGRGLFLLSLLQSPDPHISFISKYLAIDRQVEKHKEEYYLTLQRCSDGKFQNDPKQYQIEFFLKFMLKMLRESFKDIDINREKFRAFRELSPSAHQVLECFKNEPERRLQTLDILSKIRMPRRTIINSITTLLDKKFIHKYGKGRGVRYQIIF